MLKILCWTATACSRFWLKRHSFETMFVHSATSMLQNRYSTYYLIRTKPFSINYVVKHQTFNLMVTTLKDFQKFAKHVQVSACEYLSIFDNFTAFSSANAKYYVSQLLHKTVLQIFAGGRFDTYRRVKNAN